MAALNVHVGRFSMAALFSAVCAALLLLAFVYVPSQSVPSEDAAMLYIYAANLADTGTIAYNAGQGPVEGATDFLWMMVLSLLYKAGIPAFAAATALSGLALWVTARTLAGLTGGPPHALRTCLWILYVLAVPQLFAALQGFSPLVFGVPILFCIVGYLKRRFLLVLVAGLTACLIRPEGIVFAAPVALGYMAFDGAHIRRNLQQALAIAVVPGTVYFLWRWWYFGNLFPLPFYVKTQFDAVAGVFNRTALATNLRFGVALLPLLVLFFVGALRQARPERRRAMVLFLATGAVPFLFYSCIELSQNLAYRFQYPLVLTITVLAAVYSRHLSRRWMLPAAAALSLMLLAPMYVQEGLRTLIMPCENIPAVARRLGALPCRGTIATTEAGRLPYYSGWPTIDLWGLNTPELAREVVTPELILEQRPDLVVLHALGEAYGFVQDDDIPVTGEKDWNGMVRNVYLGCRRGGYRLLMVPHLRSGACDNRVGRTGVGLTDALVHLTGYHRKFPVHYMFLVRPDSPCAQAIESLLCEYGAIDFATYQARKRAWEGR